MINPSQVPQWDESRVRVVAAYAMIIEGITAVLVLAVSMAADLRARGPGPFTTGVGVGRIWPVLALIPFAWGFLQLPIDLLRGKKLHLRWREALLFDFLFTLFATGWLPNLAAMLLVALGVATFILLLCGRPVRL